MGQVYRARDTRLGRDVAIKVSSERFSERFEREAKVVASLNHPNICTLFDVGPDYLVMELIEGATLAERIAERPVPPEEALGIAKQIAAALSEAHERGIIHRDLKPANVKLTPSGTVKVLDFGLAKIGLPEISSISGNPAESPTLTVNATQAGMILGTAAYMSPEQARGKPVDKRTDIWAFGVVLYEMLTGKHPFQGEGITDTLAAVIMKEPDLEPVAPRFRRVVQHCLHKDPHKRLRDISGVTLLLDEAPVTDSLFITRPIPVPPPLPQLPPPARAPRFRNWRWPLIAAVVLTLLFWMFSSGDDEQPPTPLFAHLTMDVAPAEMLSPAFYDRPGRTAIAISPDGSTIIFAGHRAGSRALYRRALRDKEPIEIPGTAGAEHPFFSPDGQWIGFGADGKLRKVALAGGPPVDICDAGGRIVGASWSVKGMIVFRGPEGLMIVPDAGGEPKMILERDPNLQVVSRSSPQFLPDGETVLYTENTGPGWEESRIDAIDIDSKRTHTVLTNAADPRFLISGLLLFMRNADLLAVRFDANDAKARGAPVPLIAGVMQAINAPNAGEETGQGQFAVSNSGTLVYAAGGIFPTPDTDLVRVDRTGRETKVASAKGAIFNLRISPDGTRTVAVNTLNGSRSGSLWLFDLSAGGTSMRLTPQGTVRHGLWPPDGKSVLYAEAEGAVLLPLDAGAKPMPLKGGEGKFNPVSMSRDGKWLATLENSSIIVRALDGSGEKKKIGPDGANDAEFSPDSSWIAYRSAESGRVEIFIEPFPGPGPRRRVSTNGGANPAWSPNGRELFYLEPSNRPTMMAVDISAAGIPGTPKALFRGAYATTTPVRSYDVTSRGEFIMARPSSGEPIDQRVTKLTVVIGWGAEVNRRVTGN
jgi:serine/threonine-protein kinase